MFHYLDSSSTVFSVALIWLLSAAGCNRPAPYPDERESEGLMRVNAISVFEVESLSRRHTVFGNLSPTGSQVLAFSRTGQVRSLPERGQVFRSGETIAELDDSELIVRRNEITTQIENSSSPIEMGSLRTQLDTVERQIMAGRLSAPFDCLAANLFLSVGDLARERRPVIEVYRSGPPNIVAYIPTRAARKLTQDTEFVCRLSGSDVRCRIQSMSDSVDKTGAIPTRLVFGADIEQVGWRYGQVVELQFQESISVKAIAIPSSALCRSVSGDWNVKQILRNQAGLRIAEVPIELVDHKGTWCLISGDISAGNFILANGTHRVVNGQRIEIRDATAEYALPDDWKVAP